LVQFSGDWILVANGAANWLIRKIFLYLIFLYSAGGRTVLGGGLRSLTAFLVDWSRPMCRDVY